MITSTSNPKIKNLVQLQKKRKLREAEDVFLVEGIRMFREIPRELMKEIYASETFYEKNKGLFKDIDKPVVLLSDTVFQKISETKTPQGILSVVKREKYVLDDLIMKENVHLLVLDGLQDPGNVGTIIRTGEAAGVTGVVLSKDTVDLYQAKTIRSTMGSIFRVPCVYVDDIVGTVEKLKKHNIITYASHLGGEKWYNEIEYKEKIAFLVGNEGNGLSKEVAEKADTWVRIPMEGKVESLNAAVATTVLVYEAYRQRRTL